MKVLKIGLKWAVQDENSGLLWWRGMCPNWSDDISCATMFWSKRKAEAQALILSGGRK